MIRESFMKTIGIPLAESIKGMHVSKYLNEMLETQWLKSEEIQELQNHKLRMLIKHAYNTVPFYRDIMDERNLKPSDIMTTSDLSKLPILTKEIIRANYPGKMVSTIFDKSELIEMSSSGSTGEPFRYVLTNDEKARKWAGLYRFWDWAGYKMGDRFVNLTAFPPRAFKTNKLMQLLETKYAGILGLPASELYSDNVDEFVQRIIEYKPKMLRGYTSLLYFLAEVMSKKDARIKVMSVSCTGETLFDFQREIMESFFGCRVFDGYGGEGMEIAGQCDSNSGYHINAESLILEIVDCEGCACSNGVEGQIVLTDLNHYSMPFIRYNIQDLAVKTDRMCSCGRELPMLEKITGRLTDTGITPSGKSIIIQNISVIFRKVIPKIASFQVIQEKPELFVLNVVPGPGFEDVKDDIISKVQAYLGDDVTIELKVVSEIPTTKGGKRRLFISKCGIKAAGLTDYE